METLPPATSLDPSPSTRPATTDPAGWVDEHGDALYRYALLKVRDAHRAEDLVQETLLAALQARDRFAGRCSERTWLIGILKHKVMDFFRKTSRERVVEAMDVLPDEQEGPFTESGPWKGHWQPDARPAAWKTDPAATVEQKDFWQVLQRCLDALPPRHARVFWLREIEGHSAEEICKDLNISATNLWVMLHRARMQLRRSLELNWFGA